MKYSEWLLSEEVECILLSDSSESEITDWQYYSQCRHWK